MTIALIISTYNWPGALEKVLAGVCRQYKLPDELIIADDGSGDETKRVIDEFSENYSGELQHIWHEDKGFRKAIMLNRAIAASRCSYIIFLDGDCVPHPSFILDHAAQSQADYWIQGRRAFIEQASIPFFDGTPSSFLRLWIKQRASGLFKGIRWPWEYVDRGTSLKGILGCNMAAWKKQLIEVNGFDEGYEGWGREDSDLGVRLYNSGYSRKTLYGRAVVYHLNHPQAPRGNLPANDNRLARAIGGVYLKCDKGLSQYT